MFGRKGLFGRNMGFQTPGIGDGLPGMPERLPDMASVPTTAGGMYGDDMPQEAPRRPSFFGQGGVGRAIAGTIGDVLLQRNGLEPMYGPQMQMQQVFAQRQAEAQRQRAAELADYEAKKEIDARYQPAGPELGTFEDNAGNVWSYDKRTNQVVGDKPFFIDQAQRTMIQDGALIRVPNPFASGAAQGGPQPGAIEDGFRFRGGNPADPTNWEPVGGGTGGNVGGGF